MIRQISGLILTWVLLVPFLTLSSVAETVADDVQALRKGTEITSLQDLIADLNRQSVLHSVVADQDLVLVPVKKGHIDGTAGMRWNTRSGFLLIIVPMTIVENKDRLQDVETAVCQINYDHASGGFSIAPKTREVFFRLSVPFLPAGKLGSKDIEEYFSFSVREASRFNPALKAVAEGRVKGRDVLDYFTTLPADDNQIPVGTYVKKQVEITWKLVITSQGEVTLHRDDQSVVQSQATVANGVVTFADKGGELSVETPGAYRFRFPAGKLVFERVDDASEGRTKLLTESPWETQMP
ncbi:MAG: hypothetical protein R3C01_11865 [Planctomycetaceae bacterium]